MRWLSMSVLAALAACSSSQEEQSPGDTAGSAGTEVTAAGGAGGGQAGSTTTGGGTMGQGGASGAGTGGGGAPNTGGGGMSVTAKGTPGVWEPMLNWPSATQPISGDGMLADPAKPSDFYFFYEDFQPNGQPRHVLKSTDFGQTWTQIDKTPVTGNPWGVAIDPNPHRDPGTPPTMYTPAGYGDMGIWKSTDGGVTWKNLFATASNGVVPKTGGGTVTFPPGKNGEHTDFYQIHVLPDDPPNHILITYHYGAQGQPLPLGESKDGGTSWDVHLIPWGDSHYVFGVDASTWVIISGEGAGVGTYRTTTAGRMNGQISTAAWTNVSPLEHNHGFFTPFNDAAGGSLYFPGKAGISRTTDRGATWTAVYTTGSVGTLVGTMTGIYAELTNDTKVLRASASDSSKWSPVANPTHPAWWGGVPPFGAASSFDGQHWVILQAEYGKCSNNCQPARSPLLANGEIWRYIEP